MLESATEHSIDNIREKDPIAIEGVIRSYHTLLVKFVLRRGFSESDANDLVAECWATFFETSESYRGESGLKAYLTGILINKIRNYERKRSRMDLVDEADGLLESHFTEDGFWSYRPAPPDKLVEARETAQAFEKCFGKLKPVQRELFIMKKIQGLNYGEIAEAQNLTVTHVKVAMHRVRNRVRRCMEGGCVA